MKPILFTIPGIDLPVYGYGVMLGLAFVVGWYFILYTARWYGLKEDVYLGAMAAAAIMSLVGARVFHVISNPDMSWTLGRILNFREGGLVAYGGYIFGVTAGVLWFRRKNVPVWPYLDAAAPTLALGLGLTRIGCFLRGCCYGERTDSFFGLSFPPPSLVAQQHTERGWQLLEGGWSTPVLPTQLFESTTGFVLVALLLLALKRLKAARPLETAPDGPKKATWLRDGYVFLGFVGLYSTWRFLIEFVRDDGGRGTVGVLSTSQFIGILLVAAVAGWMIWRRNSPLAERLGPPKNDDKGGQRTKKRKPGVRLKKK